MRNTRPEKLFEEDGAVSANELPFLKHKDRGQNHVTMASNVRIEVKGDEIVLPEGELDLDCVAQQV